MVAGVVAILAALQPSLASAPPQGVQACGAVTKITCDTKHLNLTTIELKPKSKNLPVTILSADREHFKPSVEELFRDTDVCVSGSVETIDKRRRLVLRTPDNVTIRKRLKPAPPPWTSPYYSDCDDGLVMPVLVHEVKPSYTRKAMEALIQGVVYMDAIVGADGRVGELRITKSLDPDLGLDANAIQTVRQWRFTPGTRRGQPVPVLVQIEMRFTLR